MRTDVAATEDGRAPLTINLNLREGIIRKRPGLGPFRLRLARRFDMDRRAMWMSIIGRVYRLAGLCRIFVLLRVLRAFVARQRTDHHVNAAADQLRLKIRTAVRRNLLQEFLDDLKT